MITLRFHLESLSIGVDELADEEECARGLRLTVPGCAATGESPGHVAATADTEIEAAQIRAFVEGFEASRDAVAEGVSRKLVEAKHDADVEIQELREEHADEIRAMKRHLDTAREECAALSRTRDTLLARMAKLEKLAAFAPECDGSQLHLKKGETP